METFKSVSRWVSQIREISGADVPMLLIGNKLDREEERVVSKEQVEALAAGFNVLYFETSAK